MVWGKARNNGEGNSSLDVFDLLHLEVTLTKIFSLLSYRLGVAPFHQQLANKGLGWDSLNVKILVVTGILAGGHAQHRDLL